MSVKKMVVLCAFCLLATSAGAQQVEFNYEGRVLVDNIPVSGDGYFKFAIITKQAGGTTQWSNDLTSTTGDELAAAVIVDVSDGIFNVIIGDASLANMAALDASLFNTKDQVFLRVWFSDMVGGPFEELNPDRRITNPALLGLGAATALAK